MVATHTADAITVTGHEQDTSMRAVVLPAETLVNLRATAAEDVESIKFFAPATVVAGAVI